jgi:hypothetical protein
VLPAASLQDFPFTKTCIASPDFARISRETALFLKLLWMVPGMGGGEDTDDDRGGDDGGDCPSQPPKPPGNTIPIPTPLQNAA